MKNLVLIALVLIGCSSKSFAADVVIFATPNGIGGSNATVGSYVSQAAYLKTPTSVFGWAPSTNTPHTATDTNNIGARIVYLGRYSDTKCGTNSVTVPHPTTSPKYRFNVFFTNAVPTNVPYPINLGNGFLP